ncbi:hypothetical protein CFter6_3266 [Collimonas fungivorans]|uniref:Uncharacterized protein n=1 Tax=Collimonas fungivorans TaxID=158899 RepID=A0A127PDN5_9BURK|nr:hypothetical protein CFter6_3266 [Collimonas fungivorans]
MCQFHYFYPDLTAYGRSGFPACLFYCKLFVADYSLYCKIHTSP